MDFNKLVMITDGIILNYTESEVKNIVTDTRELVLNDVYIPLVGKKEDGSIYLEDAIIKGASIVFVTDNNIKRYLKINPDIGIIKVESGLDALKKIAKYYREMYQGKIIAITGSNGKTTTKEMLASTLEVKYKVFKSIKNYNNIIGVCKMLLKLKEEDIAIFELGMNHEGEIDEMVQVLKPNIGCITNIGTAHIGLLGSKENILKAKLEITNNDLDVLFVNNSDDYLNKVTYTKLIKYDTNNIEYIENEDNIIIYIDDTEIKVDVRGKHNLINIMSTIELSKYLELSIKDIKKGLENYQNIRMKRMISNKTLIIDDSYNANMESMKAGIDYISNLNYKNKIVILGDMLELGLDSRYYHKEVGFYIRDKSINKVYTYGNDSRYIGNVCQKISTHYTDINMIVHDLKEEMNSNTVFYFKGSRSMHLENIIQLLK